MKIRPVGAELSHADRQTDGRTDLTQLIVAFRNFAKAPQKKSTFSRIYNEAIRWLNDVTRNKC
jgi:hypothetical protein